MLLSPQTSSSAPWRSRSSSKTPAAPTAPTTPTTQDTTREDETQAHIKQLQAQIATLKEQCHEARMLGKESTRCCGFILVEKSEQSRLATYGLMILLFATLIWTSREAIVETLNYAMKDYHDGLRIGLLWLIVVVVILVVFVCVLSLPAWATTGSATGGVQHGVQSAAFMSEDAGEENETDFLALNLPRPQKASPGESQPLLFNQRSREPTLEDLKQTRDSLQEKYKDLKGPWSGVKITM